MSNLSGKAVFLSYASPAFAKATARQTGRCVRRGGGR